jgi:penicillin-binding protein 1A
MITDRSPGHCSDKDRMPYSLRPRRKLRRAAVRVRFALRGIARTRTGAASAELARAVRADLSDVVSYVRRRVPEAIPQFDWKKQAAHIRAGMRNLFTRMRVPHPTAIILVFTLGGAVAAIIWALHDLPFSDTLDRASEPIILLESADSEPMVRSGPFRGPEKSVTEFPAHLINAVISIEDQRFYSHWGIDLYGIVRALVRNIAAGKVLEGGSTITQQVVRIRNFERERTLKRKFREAVLAVWLETRLSKEEILRWYLNNAYLGAGATGIPAAARIFFDKEVTDLTLAESALLAGLIRSPSQLNPLQNLDGARARAAVVLDAMVANGTLDEQTAQAAKDQPATLKPTRLTSHSGTWFADWIYEEAAEIAGSFGGTMRVRTTLVPSLQALAERVVSNALENDGGGKRVTQAALVALQPDGAVVAMVGGRSYRESEFNRAVQGMRQPGSAFKVFVYYAALRSGMSPRDIIEDAPLEIDGWTPENFDGRYRGKVSLAEAFARSLNTATVRLAVKVGLDKVVAAARDLGIDAPLVETPSLALGSSEVSLLDLTGAFASIRAGVTPIEPWGIAAFGADDQSKLFTLGPAVKPQRALGPPYHLTMIGLLKLVVDRGTGRGAALDGFAAGKTGTSQKYRDAWFVGFTETLVVGVWVGNDDGQPMDKVTGGRLPALIWKDFMDQALAMTSGGEQKAISAAPPKGETAADEAQVQCNYRACARAYRSFRTSDCTFQPYGGRRRLCEK